LSDIGVQSQDAAVGDKHSFELHMEEGVFERMGFNAELLPLPY
jgi:hypothetical protein